MYRNWELKFNMFSHLLSYLLLTITSGWVYFHYFWRQQNDTKYISGIFFATYCLEGLFGGLSFAGFDEVESLHHYSQQVVQTVGAVSMLMLSWVISKDKADAKVELYSTVIIGITLLLVMGEDRWKPLFLIVNPFCIISAMIVACRGLLEQRKSGLWIIIAMMLLAIVRKAAVLRYPFHPIDSGNYLSLLALYSLGRASQARKQKLFGKN